MKRLSINILIFLLVLYAPWPLTLGVLVLGIVFIKYFFEGLIWVGIIHSLYGSPFATLPQFFLSYIFIAFILFWAVLLVRRYIRFYSL